MILRRQSARRMSLLLVPIMATLVSCTVEEPPELRQPRLISEIEPIAGSATPQAMLRDEVLLVSSLVDDDAVRAFDVSSGSLLWELTELSATQMVWVGDDFIVLTTDEERVEVRDLSNGEVRQEIDLEPTNLAGRESTLLEVAGDTLFLVNAEGDRGQRLSAVDLETGDELWQDSLDDKDTIEDTTSLTDHSADARFTDELVTVTDASFSMLRLRSMDDRIAAFDLKSGKELWRQPKPPTGSGYTVLATRELAVTIAWQSDGPCEFTMHAANVDSGDVRESPIHRFDYSDGWDCAKETGAVPIDGTVALAQDGEHRPQALDMETGEQLWAADQAGEPLDVQGDVATYRTTEGDVVAVEVGSGEQRWEGDSLPDFHAQLVNGFLLSAGKSNGQLATIATDLDTGEPLWNMRGATLLTADDEHVVYATETSDGFAIPITSYKPQ